MDGYEVRTLYLERTCKYSSSSCTYNYNSRSVFRCKKYDCANTLFHSTTPCYVDLSSCCKILFMVFMANESVRKLAWYKATVQLRNQNLVDVTRTRKTNYFFECFVLAHFTVRITTPLPIFLRNPSGSSL